MELACRRRPPTGAACRSRIFYRHAVREYSEIIASLRSRVVIAHRAAQL